MLLTLPEKLIAAQMILTKYLDPLHMDKLDVATDSTMFTLFHEDLDTRCIDEEDRIKLNSLASAVIYSGHGVSFVI